MTPCFRRLRTAQRTHVFPGLASVAANPCAPSLERTQKADWLRRLSVVAIWRDALMTLSTHSAAILFFAFVGFALPTIIGNWLYTSAKLSEYARTRAFVTLYDRPLLSTLLVQVGLSVVALTFARGAITWLALFGKQHLGDSTVRGYSRVACAACRATFVRYPALLVGSLLYGIVITAGVAMISEFMKGLEFFPNKIAHIWAGPHRAFGDMLRQLEWRSFNALLPIPNFPFIELLPHLHAFRRVSEQAVQLDQLAVYGIHIRLHTEFAFSASEFWIISVSSIVFMFGAEVLLRFRTVMTMKPLKSDGIRGFNIFTPLIDSARLGVSHFGTIMLHIWLVRLVIFAFSVVLIEFPTAMTDHFVTPNIMRFGDGFELLPITRFGSATASALVGGILLAFSTAYDAQLFKRLMPLQIARVADTAPEVLITHISYRHVEHRLD